MKKNNATRLTLRIFIGLLMPGRFEWALPAINLVSILYMNALRTMIFPLVFCSLVVGIKGIGSVSRTGKIGLQTFCSLWAPRCLPAC